MEHRGFKVGLSMFFAWGTEKKYTSRHLSVCAVLRLERRMWTIAVSEPIFAISALSLAFSCALFLHDVFPQIFRVWGLLSSVQVLHVCHSTLKFLCFCFMRTQRHRIEMIRESSTRRWSAQWSGRRPPLLGAFDVPGAGQLCHFLDSCASQNISVLPMNTFISHSFLWDNADPALFLGHSEMNPIAKTDKNLMPRNKCVKCLCPTKLFCTDGTVPLWTTNNKTKVA